MYCGDCIRYKCKASDLANTLLDEIDNNHFKEYAKVKRSHVKEFENFEELIASLKALSEIKCKTPCGSGGDGCGGACEIIQCVHEQNLNGCWECGKYERCEKLDFLKSYHGHSIVNNLRKIKKYGLANWVGHRDKCYPWL